MVLDCALAVGDESDGAEAANVVSANGPKREWKRDGLCLAAAGAAEPVPCSAQWHRLRSHEEAKPTERVMSAS